jgi:putative oxidoreductase
MKIDETSIFFLSIRIILGIIFIYHGFTKVNSKKSLDSWNTYVISKGFNSFIGIFAAYLEIFLGIFIILGLFTRIISVLIAIYMLFAIFIAHYGSPINTYLYQICILILAIMVSVKGYDNYSIDHIIKN